MAQEGHAAGLDAVHREALALRTQLADERAADRRRASELRALEVRIIRLAAELGGTAVDAPQQA